MFFFVAMSIALFFVIPRSVMLDVQMWSYQLQYVEHRDPLALNFYAAYGHPGTTIVEGGLLIRWMFGLSYQTAMIAALSILTALAATATVGVARILRPDSRWWLGIAAVVSVNRMSFTTPPTMLVMPVLALLVLLTWRLIERPASTWRWAFVWGSIAGFSAATRLDMTALLAPLLLVTLWRHLGWRWVSGVVVVAAAAFIAFDPFFWTMPIQHAFDLVRKFTIHYSEFTLAGSHLLDLSSIDFYLWPIIGIVLSIATLRQKMDVPPRALLLALYTATVVLAAVVLTSSYRSLRYFLPLMYLWNVIVTYYLFTYTPKRLSLRWGHAGTPHLLVLLRFLYLCLTIGWLLMTAYLLWYGGKPQ